jgi:hypothetical protein
MSPLTCNCAAQRPQSVRSSRSLDEFLFLRYFIDHQFHCTSVEDYGNQRTVIVRGALLTGTVSPGMSLCVKLNASFEMAVPISNVIDSGQLWVDCDDQNGVDMLMAFDIANEYLNISS